jgi:arsenite-transporting ATPase
MRLSLSFRKKKPEDEQDPVLDYLTTFHDRIDQMRTLITDKEKSAFFFLTLLESLPIAVIKRFIGWFRDFGIPIGGAVINEVIDTSEVNQNTAEFILNRIAMQEQYRGEVVESFDNVCGEVPQFEREVKGLPMVTRVTNALFGSPSP